MKKFSFPALLALLISLAGCNNDGSTSSALLSNSTGGFDEILVVLDKSNKALVDSVKDPMLEPYEVLPQPEPIFDTRIIDYENFDRIFKRFRTIVFMAPLNEPSALSEYVKKTIGNDNVQRALQNENFYYALKKNVWAEPQLIIYIFEPDVASLIERTNKLDKVIALIEDNELEKYKNNNNLKGWNHELTASLRTQYNIHLKIPEDFVLAQEEGDFIWLRKILPEYNSNIMIDIKDLSGDTIDPITWRNELGKQFISTTVEGSYMVSDTILLFAREKATLNGLEVEITRGLWKMQGDFMGGPFINYLIKDPVNDRMILIDGFVYAPGEKKKPMIRTLEAIFSGFAVTADS